MNREEKTKQEVLVHREADDCFFCDVLIMDSCSIYEYLKNEDGLIKYCARLSVCGDPNKKRPKYRDPMEVETKDWDFVNNNKIASLRATIFVSTDPEEVFIQMKATLKVKEVLSDEVLDQFGRTLWEQIRNY